MLDFVTRYNESGIACLPTKQDKSPYLKESWNNGFAPQYFIGADGLGVICGAISGGLECMDFDNHFGDATKIIKEYLAIPEVRNIVERNKLPIETSQRGGYHLLFRCAKNDGNRKLAQRKNSTGRPEAIIETRGEGGYFMAYPSKGYRVVKYDIFNIATISQTERAILIDNALSMNEFYPPLITTEYETKDRPGDLYNANPDSIAEMKSILKEHGWVNVEGYKWRRPDKSDGISATLGKVAPSVFYVFTANGYPFEPLHGYSPFQVLGLLKFNGDWKEAAKSIAPEKTSITKTPKINPTELDKILLENVIDISTPIDKPPTILSIKEQEASMYVYRRVFTLGNFSCIIGKAKSKKTFLVSMLTASLMNNDCNSKFVSDLPKNKNKILYFDTEQGSYDSYVVIKRIQDMAGNSSNMLAFNLRSFSPLERCQLIEYAFKVYGNSVGFCVIDGIADLSNAINDEDEATRVSTFLLRVTKEYNCHICTVLHQNKNYNFATGHLGSSIMKKAEIIISVTKVKEDKRSSEISNDMSRGVDFEPFIMTINSDGFPHINGNSVIKKESNPFETDYEPTQSNSDSGFPF